MAIFRIIYYKNNILKKSRNAKREKKSNEI